MDPKAKTKKLEATDITEAVLHAAVQAQAHLQEW